LFLRSLEAPHTDRARNTAAIERLRQALTLDPRFALARAHVAYRLMALSNYDDASYLDEGIKEGEAAVAADPNLAYGYFALGTAYGRKGLAAQSRQAFQRAIELDPNDTGAMINFKNEEIRRGRLDEALYWSRRSFLRSGKGAEDRIAPSSRPTRFSHARRTAKKSGSSGRTLPIYSTPTTWRAGPSR
jgi:tetratricopeptide (TPR) repeat protein